MSYDMRCSHRVHFQIKTGVEAMKIHIVLVVLAFTVIIGDGLIESKPRKSLPTVPKLNVTKYLGRWYQMYEDLIVQDTFERKGFCCTADYGLFQNGSVSVRNAERVGSPDGKPNIIEGYAYKPDPKVDGQFRVHLSGVLFGAPYWVVLLGPDTYGTSGLYQYSVVTDNLSFTLFVLARNVTEFKANYADMMLKNLTDLGFHHFYNKPIATYQGADCEYV